MSHNCVVRQSVMKLETGNDSGDFTKWHQRQLTVYTFWWGRTWLQHEKGESEIISLPVNLQMTALHKRTKTKIYDDRIAIAVKKYIFRLEIAVQNMTTMHVRESFDDTCCIKLGILLRDPIMCCLMK